MKHPILVGAAVGIVGLVAWWKRHVIVAAWGRLRGGATMRGFGGPITGLPATADPSVCAKQIERYTFAAMQDQSPIVGLTHASYALILMDTLEEMIGRAAIAVGWLRSCGGPTAHQEAARRPRREAPGMRPIHVTGAGAQEGRGAARLRDERRDGRTDGSLDGGQETTRVSMGRCVRRESLDEAARPALIERV